MSAEHTLSAMSQFCKNSSGDSQRWQGNKATYCWNRGRTTADGTINGVVRKFGGIAPDGKEMWSLAGSLKILADGKITHFTGLSKKNWKLLEGITAITITAQQTVAEENV